MGALPVLPNYFQDDESAVRQQVAAIVLSNPIFVYVIIFFVIDQVAPTVNTEYVVR